MIELTREGPVLVLRMDADENRFHPDFIRRFAAALDEIEGVEGPAALVSVGSGKFYSNGLDVEWMSAHHGELAGYLRSALALLARVLTLPMPTVAAVNGHAFGLGGQLVVAHDRAIMRRERGYWCMPEIDMRARLHPGMTALIQARIPARTAHESIVSGQRYTAGQALVAGVVDEVADADEVLPRALAWASELAPKAHPVMRELKRDLYPQVLAALEKDLERA